MWLIIDQSSHSQAVSSTQQNRHEQGASRPTSRAGATSTLSRPLLNHRVPTNPAKPPKRPREDEAGPGLRQGPSRSQAANHGALPQQPDAKRRRTEDEECNEGATKPTIFRAPVRQSNLGKKTGIFAHGYAPAPHLNQGQGQVPQYPPAANSHRVGKASDMSKYANGNKIPFADPNMPTAQAHHHMTPSSHQKAPALPPKSTLQLVKSSPNPQYTPGETIALPEIPTDSEDEADDSADEAARSGPGGGNNSFPVPSWASPTTLTNHLLAQESVDGDAVFGPIAPLRIEEIFAKGGSGSNSSKDRFNKLRQRTSSANWITSGDGLTIEEVRADREMRERMRIQGGWRY